MLVSPRRTHVRAYARVTLDVFFYMGDNSFILEAAACGSPRHTNAARVVLPLSLSLSLSLSAAAFSLIRQASHRVASIVPPVRDPACMCVAEMMISRITGRRIENGAREEIDVDSRENANVRLAE